MMVGQFITHFSLKCVMTKIYLIIFDQCHVTKNHKDYSNRQQQ